MTDLPEIERTVRQYILDSFLGDEDTEAFRDDDDLLTVLDSLQILRMVVALEGLFAIKVQDSDLSPDNLGSVRRVAAFVARKCGEPPAAADPNGQPAAGPEGVRCSGP